MIAALLVAFYVAFAPIGIDNYLYLPAVATLIVVVTMSNRATLARDPLARGCGALKPARALRDHGEAAWAGAWRRRLRRGRGSGSRFANQSTAPAAGAAGSTHAQSSPSPPAPPPPAPAGRPRRADRASAQRRPCRRSPARARFGRGWGFACFAWARVAWAARVGGPLRLTTSARLRTRWADGYWRRNWRTVRARTAGSTTT